MTDPADAAISDRARELQFLADILLPGDALFPPASAVGAHGLLAERLRERIGSHGIDEVLRELAAATAGISLGMLDGDARVAAMRRFERDAPGVFAQVRGILYFSYYQNPLVTAAIRSLGIAYNDAPQPCGYEMAPFDATPGSDAPLHPRGSFKATESVIRLANLHVPSAARESRDER